LALARPHLASRLATVSRVMLTRLSPSFFAKNWPQYELDGLVTKEMTGNPSSVAPDHEGGGSSP